jgi:hypothetical protein
MTNTIKSKIQVSTTRIYNETFDIMVEFGIITPRQKELIVRIIDDFKYDKKILQYSSLDIFFRYNKELFDKELLDKVGNPQEFSFNGDNKNE